MSARYGPGTALVVVDVQNDFADPAGSLYVGAGEEVVEAANAHVDAARSAGSPIYYTMDWHPPATPHFDTDGGIWPVHCVAGSWGAQLHPRLMTGGEVVRKGSGGEDGYSGFAVRDPGSGATTPTELEEMLRTAGIDRIVVVGLAGDYCVKETALDASALLFDTTVDWSAVRCVNRRPGDDAAARSEMAARGVKLI